VSLLAVRAVKPEHLAILFTYAETFPCGEVRVVLLLHLDYQRDRRRQAAHADLLGVCVVEYRLHRARCEVDLVVARVDIGVDHDQLDIDRVGIVVAGQRVVDEVARKVDGER